MRNICIFLTVDYLCGLFLNASLILIVLMNWPVTAIPFWFRLILAAAPLYFLLSGLLLRKDRPESPKTFLTALEVFCGLLMIPAVVLAVLVPESVLGWFIFPVSGDIAAVLGQVETWRPVYSFLGAVGAPLLFWIGTLLCPMFYPQNGRKEKRRQ